MLSERRQFARALRKQATKAEDILWAQLRASRFHGAKFRRQAPFDRYVADFYCHAAKLVIELDGSCFVPDFDGALSSDSKDALWENSTRERHNDRGGPSSDTA